MATGIAVGRDIEDELAELYSSVTVEIVRITPAIAQRMLSRNKRNRPLSETHVKNLSDSFLAGDMILNGETIIFDIDEYLLNGQHRLQACIETKTPWDSIVIRGIDPEAFKTLDSGRKRSTADTLTMQGESHAANIASAAQALIAFVDFGGAVRHTTTHARKATPAAVERVLAAHPRLRQSVYAMRKSKRYDNQNGYLLHYLFSTVDPRLAKDFAEVLAAGHTDIGRPFVRLRETLLVDDKGKRNDMRRMNAAKAVKAFNAERRGQRVKQLKFHKNEAFPSIDGLDYDAVGKGV
jgi:hypothetical protein